MKNNICEKCGLPVDLCVCEQIIKEQQSIIITNEKRKYNKDVTIITGIDSKGINIKYLLKTFKKKLACGGSFKNSNIELQGSHIERAKGILIKMGYFESQIKII